MGSIQIYPPVDSSGYTEESYATWLKDLLATEERKGFQRGVSVTYWFFYKIINRGLCDGFTKAPATDILGR